MTPCWKLITKREIYLTSCWKNVWASWAMMYASAWASKWHILLTFVMCVSTVLLLVSITDKRSSDLESCNYIENNKKQYDYELCSPWQGTQTLSRCSLLPECHTASWSTCKYKLYSLWNQYTYFTKAFFSFRMSYDFTLYTQMSFCLCS
jgi:hypothetical protein